MSYRFIIPDLSDKRITFASEYLESKGYIKIEKEENADFVLLGVNPDKSFLNYNIPTFAGNISADNVFDYTKNEAFALKNAFLTTEGALALAVCESKRSLINSNTLITGYGRIGKALHAYLAPFTRSITVCARSASARAVAESLCAKTIDFADLTDCSSYNYIFNTVPHPIFNSRELCSVKKDAVIIDLASFPGGVDKHIARVKGLHLLTARGLPSKYSPATAGKVVGQTVDEMIIKEVFV